MYLETFSNFFYLNWGSNRIWTYEPGSGGSGLGFSTQLDWTLSVGFRFGQKVPESGPNRTVTSLTPPSDLQYNTAYMYCEVCPFCPHSHAQLGNAFLWIYLKHRDPTILSQSGNLLQICQVPWNCQSLCPAAYGLFWLCIILLENWFICYLGSYMAKYGYD